MDRITNALIPYAEPHAGRSWWQLSSTAAGFIACWSAALYSLDELAVLTPVFVVLAAIFNVRLFIIQHDCGHGSFFSTRRANDVAGSILGVVNWTPYADWRRHHAIHHATSGNLDKRGAGDIDTLTVREYLARSVRQRLLYRLVRHPVTILLAGPAYQFLVRHRLPASISSGSREWASVVATNLALLVVGAALSAAVGWARFAAIELPVACIGASIGVWLFYVQHQFEDTYWARGDEWHFEAAGVAGSSFYDLPAVLHWCTGNIGFHHIHHLCPRIPNYRLRESHDAHVGLVRVTRLTFGQSLRCFQLHLWDEERRKLVGFGDVKSFSA